jgi:hypothetical protein
MRGRWSDFRDTPYGGADHDLEDEHIEDEATRRQPEDGGQGQGDQQKSDAVMGVQQYHVRGAFA